MNPQDQAAVQKVVLAGKKLMFDPKTFATFKQGMTKNMPMPDKLATEAAGLMKLLQDKAQGAIPRQVLLPAAAMLLIEIAKFMQDAKLGAPMPQDLKAALTKLVPLLLKVFPNKAQQPQAPAAPMPSAQPPGLINQGAQYGTA